MSLSVHRIEHGGTARGLGETHAHRNVIPPGGDHAAQSPFLHLVEDRFAPPAGFPTHPHRGMETVTVVLGGELVHDDHTGAHGVLHEGDVQFMTAGSGVLHSELPGPEGVHTLQLWLNLPAGLKGAAPQYTDVRKADARPVTAPGMEARLYAGSLGEARMPWASTWPMTLIDVALEAGAEYELPLPAGERAFLYVLAGEAEAARTAIGADDVAWIGPAGEEGNTAWCGLSDHEGADTLTLSAKADFRALAYASPGIDEPVVAWGPFVMSTVEEIERAVADLEAGTFVK